MLDTPDDRLAAVADIDPLHHDLLLLFATIALQGF